MKAIYGIIAVFFLGVGALASNPMIGKFFVIQEGVWNVYTASEYSVSMSFNNKDRRVCIGYRDGGWATISRVECGTFSITDERTVLISMEAGESKYRLYNPVDDAFGTGNPMDELSNCGDIGPDTIGRFFKYPTIVLQAGPKDSHKCFYLKNEN